MAELLQANWILLVIALMIGVLVAWWVFVASRRTKVEIEEKGEDSPTGAKRNQALIDAPPAARKDDPAPPPPAPEGLGGAGTAVSTAAAGQARGEQAPNRAARNLATDTEDEQAATAAASPGPTSAAANSDAIAAAGESADAEAGEAVPAREAIRKMADAEPAPEPSSAALGSDDLTRIKGVGPKLSARLAELGVTSFAQIAAWDDAEIDRIDSQLGRFEGRIRRDNWVEQAGYLTKDDIAGFEARFGRT